MPASTVKYSFSIPTSSSGETRSDSVVNPATSVNITVAWVETGSIAPRPLISLAATLSGTYLPSRSRTRLRSRNPWTMALNDCDASSISRSRVDGSGWKVSARVKNWKRSPQADSLGPSSVR